MPAPMVATQNLTANRCHQHRVMSGTVPVFHCLCSGPFPRQTNKNRRWKTQPRQGDDARRSRPHAALHLWLALPESGSRSICGADGDGDRSPPLESWRSDVSDLNSTMCHPDLRIVDRSRCVETGVLDSTAMDKYHFLLSRSCYPAHQDNPLSKLPSFTFLALSRLILHCFSPFDFSPSVEQTDFPRSSDPSVFLFGPLIMYFTRSLMTATFAVAATALPKAAPTASSSGTAASSSASSGSDGGGGGVQIINNLGSTVYLWSTSSGAGSMQEVNSGGGTYSENWQTNSDGGGISIKMSTSQSQDSVLQFEYTTSGEDLFWDLSSIDLDSSSDFVSSGFSATPDDSSCKSVSCSAGDSNCAESYQKSDDKDTNSCSSSAGFTLTLG